MRKLVSSATALAADRAAEDVFGYPPGMLMEEAGIRLQDRLDGLVLDAARIRGPLVYLVGPGNNGGDALVMARQAFLAGRPNLSVVRVGAPRSESCRRQDAWVRQLGVPHYDYPSEAAQAALDGAALWVDGLWGTGLSGGLRPDQAALLAQLEARRAQLGVPTVALDVPSGLWSGWQVDQPVLRARWTLAPGWAKDFCYYPEARSAAGTVVAVPLGFPQAAEAVAELVETDDLRSLVPVVDPFAHKGRRGHVALVGGSAGMTGAVVLAARSAAAAGAGLVSVGTDADAVALVAPQVPAFQVRTTDEVLDRVGRYGAWVVGPGWGRGSDRPRILGLLWATDLPLVVDADGLGAWLALRPAPRSAPVVFTPHPGEFARLSPGTGPLVERAVELARNSGAVVVLKGAVTWVVDPEGRRSVWDGPNPALGTGGSGDCLAGVVGALLAAGLDGYQAARTAVALHGASGRELADAEGWFTADRLPEALARVSSACRTGGLTV